MTSQPNCVGCGRFMSWKVYVTWTPFGTVLDLEPPDEVYCCAKCYANPKNNWIPRLGEVWQGPTLIDNRLQPI